MTLFIIAYVSINPLSGFKNWWHSVQLKIINKLGKKINPFNKFFIFIRFFFKSRNYRKAFYSFYNNRFSQAIDYVLKIDKSKRDLTLKKILTKSLRQLGRSSEAIHAQGEINGQQLIILKERQNVENSSVQQAITKGTAQYGIITTIEESKISKITKTKRFRARPSNRSVEVYFYRFSQQLNPEIKKYLPKYLDYDAEKKVGHLTLDFVNGRAPQLADIELILDFQKTLMETKFKDLIHNSNFKEITPYIFYRMRLLPFSSKQEITSLITNYQTRIHSYNHSDFDVDSIKLLKKIYLTPFINNLLNLREDLVLQHLDFGSHNSRIDEEGKLKVFDWDSYSVSLPGLDILGFILGFTFDFNYVEHYLIKFLEEIHIIAFDVVSAYLVLLYLDRLINQPEGVRIQENWNLAIDYLRKSPLNH